MGIKIVSENKKARFDYEIVETLEAGLVLTGSEVKSLRNGAVQLKDSYIAFKGHEAFWQKGHIAEYKSSSYNNHEPERPRKLLLKLGELSKLSSQIQQKGLTCVPLKIYFKDGRAKLQLGVARGKKVGDKRAAIKTRDVQRELASTRRKG